MQASWHALHSHLLRTTSTLSFATRFRALRSRHPALRSFDEPPQVLAFLHAPEPDGERRNLVLRDLVRAARGSDGTGDVASTLLLLGLWPGLDAVHGRLLRHFRDCPEELASEIAAHVSEGIGRLDLDRVRWIAATLVRNAERDIRRALARDRAEAACRAPLPEDGPPVASYGPDPEAETRRLVLHLRESIGEDALLVVAVAIEGRSQREAAEGLGIGHEAARKRYQRALGRLRPVLAAAG